MTTVSRGRVGLRIAAAERSGAVGRDEELSELLRALQPDGPVVTLVHGIGGIGKSTLLGMFVAEARRRGATVVVLDGRTIEPTDAGFMRAVREATGAEAATLAGITRRLRALGTPTIVVVDSYELLRLIDTWLRQTFIPALSANARLVLAGREAPVWAWYTAPGMRGIFRQVRLGELTDVQAGELLERNGFERSEAARINTFARGHPLALQLAIAAGAGAFAPGHAGSAQHQVVEALAGVFLSDVPDQATRRALEAASTVRTATRSLLGAMLPDQAPQDAFDRLKALPFVEAERDGLRLHDSVHAAIASRLQAADPAGYRDYRRAAWGILRQELRAAGEDELWRYTADVLFLLDNAIIRDAFFPKGSHDLAVEPALPADEQAVAEITAAHEGSEATSALTAWWRKAPGCFQAIRSATDRVAGFYVLGDVSKVPTTLGDDDPMWVACREHLRSHPMEPGETALICRRWLSRVDGEMPSPVQAAAWLDLKRTYVQLRPRLRRVYCVASALEPYAPALTRLRFQPVGEAVRTLDGRTYHTALLDLGPESIDGWLAHHIETELGIAAERCIELDEAAREIIVAGQRLPLTRLEFGVMRRLSARPGAVVERQALLAEVWGYQYDGGSNVVDVVVKGLRRKLGDHAGAIETVRGAGYRLRG